MSGAIPIECVGCGADLHAYNLTRLCAECKLIARNQRAGHRPDTEAVTEAQALANLAAVFGAKPPTVQKPAP